MNRRRFLQAQTAGFIALAIPGLAKAAEERMELFGYSERPAGTKPVEWAEHLHWFHDQDRDVLKTWYKGQWREVRHRDIAEVGDVHKSIAAMKARIDKEEA